MKYGMSIIVRGAETGRETFDAMAEKAERTGVKELDLSGLGLETLPTAVS